MSNFGSLPLPCVWNGPVRLSEIGPWTCESPPWTSTLIARSSLPESTFFSPENVSSRTWSTLVSSSADGSAALVTASTTDDEGPR